MDSVCAFVAESSVGELGDVTQDGEKLAWLGWSERLCADRAGDPAGEVRGGSGAVRRGVEKEQDEGRDGETSRIAPQGRAIMRRGGQIR